MPDAVVVGGGPNGLVAAGLLARAGLSVVLLETGPVLGGGCRTVEFAPGFRASELAHLTPALYPAIAQRLDLARRGLIHAVRQVPTTVLLPGADPLALEGTWGERLRGPVSPPDAEAFRGLRERLLAMAGVLAPALAAPPPRLKGGGPADLLSLLGLGWRSRRLGRERMRDLLRIVLMNVHDLVEETVADPRLAAFVAFEAVLGTNLGPRAPTTVTTLLHRLAMGPNRDLVAGGAGTLAAVVARAAEEEGVVLRPGTPVARILVERGRVAGVRTRAGEEIRANIVLAAMDPKAALLDLVGPAEIDIDLARRVRALRSRGTVARVLLAIRGDVAGPGLDVDMLAGRLLVLDGMSAIEAAADAVKYADMPARPALEVTVPSLTDPALAPSGHHVISVSALHVPTQPRDPGSARAALVASVLAQLEERMPGLAGRVIAHGCILPSDMERDLRVPGGCWHHVDLAADQMLMLRPVQALAQYRTPIEGLWLCGAGSHPGGGVSGLPALLAVDALLGGRR